MVRGVGAGHGVAPWRMYFITRLKIGAIGLQQRVNVERPSLAPRQDVGGERITLFTPVLDTLPGRDLIGILRLAGIRVGVLPFHLGEVKIGAGFFSHVIPCGVL